MTALCILPSAVWTHWEGHMGAGGNGMTMTAHGKDFCITGPLCEGNYWSLMGFPQRASNVGL